MAGYKGLHHPFESSHRMCPLFLFLFSFFFLQLIIFYFILWRTLPSSSLTRFNASSLFLLMTAFHFQYLEIEILEIIIARGWKIRQLICPLWIGLNLSATRETDFGWTGAPIVYCRVFTVHPNVPSKGGGKYPADCYYLIVKKDYHSSDPRADFSAGPKFLPVPSAIVAAPYRSQV